MSSCIELFSVGNSADGYSEPILVAVELTNISIDIICKQFNGSSIVGVFRTCYCSLSLPK